LLLVIGHFRHGLPHDQQHQAGPTYS
jgi:hypothetical protein